MAYLDEHGVVTLTAEIKAYADQTYEATGSVSTHNQDNTAHTDIRNAIPTKTSELINDSGFITEGGAGLPSGGTAGQIIIKNSSADGDASWVSPATSVIADNTLPITSGAVYTEVGNINALLATI